MLIKFDFNEWKFMERLRVTSKVKKERIFKILKVKKVGKKRDDFSKRSPDRLRNTPKYGKWEINQFEK